MKEPKKESMNEQEKEEQKKKKVHNYVILIALFLGCILVVLYLCKLFTIQREEALKIPVIRDSLGEIYYEDLEHYLKENPTSVIYMCVANNDTCRSFEKKFKKLLQKKNYNDEIIYLNLTDADQEEVINHFNQKYSYKNGVTNNYPLFVFFEDGKIKSILQGNKNKPLTISKVKSFFELNEIGE